VSILQQRKLHSEFQLFSNYHRNESYTQTSHGSHVTALRPAQKKKKKKRKEKEKENTLPYSITFSKSYVSALVLGAYVVNISYVSTTIMLLLLMLGNK
jgi:hypothetical protein